MVLSYSAVLKVRRHLGFVIVAQDTFLIERENSRDIELTINDSVSQNFFHHLFLGRLAVSASYEVALLHASGRWALGISSACVSLGLGLVWSALFSHEITVFGKVAMEERPATVTAFSEVIAGHQLLGRQDWYFSAVLHFETRFDHLGKRHGVARATGALIAKGVSKVKPVDVSEVVGFWQHGVRDFFCCLVLLLPFLGHGKCFLKLDSTSLPEFLGDLILLNVGLSLGKLLSLLAVLSVLSVMLLKLARVSCPAEVLVVDERDCFVSFLRRNVLHVSIDSVGWLPCLLLSFALDRDGRGQLDVAVLVWGLGGDDLVLTGDDCYLDGVRFGLHGDCLFHVVVGSLFGVEALDEVLIQAVGVVGD